MAEIYDQLATEIRKRGYTPKSSMENFVATILSRAVAAVENGTDILMDETNDLIWWVNECGGFKEFDIKPM